MKSATISVVLTTYNGEQFLQEQLESILRQSRKVDELLIFDDCSLDKSVEMAERIIAQFGDINAKIIKNSENKGWRANFIHGFHMASGDIIFCADQDDIWDEHKIEKMTRVMEENERINVLCSNLNPLYHEGAVKLANFAVNEYGEQLLEKVSLNGRGFTVLRPGCTMCFRRSIIDQIDLIWEPILAHDEVIWAIGIATDSLYIYNEPLIQFRRHGKNNSPSNRKMLSVRLERAICTKTKVEKLLAFSEKIGISEEAKTYCNRVLKNVNKRIKALTERSIIAALSFFPGIKNRPALRSWLADLYTIIRAK